jgi:hypothetical protein
MRSAAAVVLWLLIGVFGVDAQTSSSGFDLTTQCELAAQERIVTSQVPYGGELEALKNMYQLKGDQENVGAVKKEQDRFKNDDLVQEIDLVKSPEALRNLQLKYIQLGQRAVGQYLGELEAKKNTLTIQGKADAAMQVKRAVEKLQQRYPSPGTMILGTWLCHAINVHDSAEFTMTFSPNGDFVSKAKTREDRGRWILKDGLPYVQWDNWIKVTSVTPSRISFTNKLGKRYVGSKQ